MVITKHKIHQYRRVKLTNSIVYRCVLPGCTHYIRPQFIINQIALCPYCGNNYLISRELSRREVLHCADCTKGKKIKVEDNIEFLDTITPVENETGE